MLPLGLAWMTFAWVMSAWPITGVVAIAAEPVGVTSTRAWRPGAGSDSSDGCPTPELAAMRNG